jgi:DNA-binding NtrC family response regulator
MYRAILGGAINYAVDQKEWLRSNPFRKIKMRRTKSKRLRIAAQTTQSSAHKIIPIPILTALVSDAARWRVDAKRQEIDTVLARHHGIATAAAADLGVSLATVYNRLARQDRQEDPRWMVVYCGRSWVDRATSGLE